MNGPMKSAAVYGGLLAVLLGVSWARWTAEPALELDGKVVMVAGEPDDLLSVTWRSENRDEAVITKKSDEHGDYYWVDYTRWTEVKPAKPAPKPPSADGEGAEGEEPPEALTPEPTYETSEQSFKSSDKAEAVFEDLAPLLALRKLSDITDEKREATGLAEAKESVELQKSGKTVRIRFGGEVYGTRDRYAQIEGGDDIYLVDDELLRSLKFARTRLPDRSLWPTATKNLAKVTVAAGENSVELVQKNAADPSKAAWVRASAPDEDATQAQTWMEKALKLKSVRYADDDDEVDALEPVFSLTLEDDKGASMTVEVLQEPGDNPEYYARSPHTRGVVRLLRGPSDQLAQDVATMVEGG
jgi:hypothetical protein